MKLTLKKYFKILLQFFLQGVVVLAPIGITVWVIVSLFNVIDDLLPNLLSNVFPNYIKKDINGNFEKITGLGFVMVIMLVLFVGWLSSLLQIGKALNIFDKVLENTPGIKIIYSSVKDFFEAFAGNKKKFDKPVLVNVDANNVWRIGFITKSDATDFDLKDHLVVYVPHSYAISGITYFVPKSNVKELKNITATNAMKFTVSGGVVDFDDVNDKAN
ncbi:MAG TPA: DUF502 domain-containing protein [Chitinophagaceae bacterium]|nr:DUF502 domain-containing protein [Chitinophagaceae bacterium]